jgi:hypothetical protein
MVLGKHFLKLMGNRCLLGMVYMQLLLLAYNDQYHNLLLSQLW